MKNLKHFWIIAFILFAISCNNDDAPKEKPTISFEGMESGIYNVKQGAELKITPIIKNATNPKYTWEIDGKNVGSELSYTFLATKVGEYYITFYLKSDNGNLQEEIRVDVLEKTPPLISFAIPEEGYLSVNSEENLEIEPQVKFGKDAEYIWKLNNKEVSKETKYIFNQKDLGKYELELTVSNEDGKDTKSVTINVVGKSNIKVSFVNKNENVPLGRALVLAPFVENKSEQTKYSWKVNGELIDGENSSIFSFTPKEKGEYTVTVIAKDGATSVSDDVTVKCVDEEGTFYRAANENSTAGVVKVFSFIPAPGQFINENYTTNSLEEANAHALSTLNKKYALSLGGFGGYIVVGFDHSIDNVGNSPDFEIVDNAFANNSEPGIVWVMQDENGNGLPDDTWYELKGSEYGKPETKQNYSVTYFRPSAPQMNVDWKDSEGNTGFVDYLKAFHRQDYYYPNWVKENSYTLYGTCLGQRNVNEGGMWKNISYDWGYADNLEKDRKPTDRSNKFDIENAILINGKPAELKYIDFVKVQTGVNGKSGMLGEISTEISGVNDLKIK